MSQLSCRFYANPSPKCGDVVLVRCTRRSWSPCGVVGTGAGVYSAVDGIYVHLLEYDGLEVYVPITELKQHEWIMDSYIVPQLDELLCAEVLNVYRDVDRKLVVDLSLKRVTQVEATNCRRRYCKGKCVQSILRQVALRLGYSTTKEDFEVLYMKSAWKVEQTQSGRLLAYDFFKKAANGDADILSACDVDQRVLLEEIRKRLVKKAVEISCRFELTCNRKDGIDSIKDAVLCGLQCSTSDVQLKVQVVSCPEFIIKTKASDEFLAAKIVQEDLDAIERKILQLGGNFKIVSKDDIFYSRTVEGDDSGVEKELEDMTINEDSGIGDCFNHKRTKK